MLFLGLIWHSTRRLLSLSPLRHGRRIQAYIPSIRVVCKLWHSYIIRQGPVYEESIIHAFLAQEYLRSVPPTYASNEAPGHQQPKYTIPVPRVFFCPSRYCEHILALRSRHTTTTVSPSHRLFLSPFCAPSALSPRETTCNLASATRPHSLGQATIPPRKAKQQ